MDVITSHLDLHYTLYIKDSELREPGLHVSTVTRAMLKGKYPKWFKDYDDDETVRQIRIFEKGHVVEEAWGDALARMVPFFDKPGARKVDEIWMSPDGYAPSSSDTTLGHWPYDKECPLHLPAIFECKGGLKSTNPPKNHNGPYITHPKFSGWHYNIMAYCYGWGCQDAYLFSHHFNGDWSGHPPEPQLWVHHLHWDQEELEEHWEDIVTYAKDHPELEHD